MKKVLAIALLLSMAFANCVVLFWGKGCPHCAQAKPWLENLQKELNFTLVEYEIYYNKENREIFAKTAFYFNSTPLGVPTIVAGNKIFIGFTKGEEERYANEYKAWIGTTGALRKAIEEGGECPRTVYNGSFLGNPKVITGNKKIEKVEVEKKEGFLKEIESKIMEFYKEEGEYSPANLPSLGHVLASGLVLGLSDGILNPCTLSVIIFLAVYLISIKAKKRLLSCGIAYVIAVAIVYGIFLVALLLLVQSFFFSMAGSARLLLAFITFIFGMFEIRDALVERGKEVLAIGKSFKEKINRLIKLATPASAFVVGALAALAEIPCAGSFPLVYTGLIHNFPKAVWPFFVIWYLFFFAFPLLLLVLAFHFGLSTEKVEKLYEKHRRKMRIFAGLLLIAFAIWFVAGG